jgi:chloramphenicol 3-O phosphotransferase
MSGRIVILNGAPRAGKSSIAAAVMTRLPGRWINLGVDEMRRRTPEEEQPGIGLRPGGERPDLEPAVQRLYAELYDDIARNAREGFDVVVDVGHHDWYSRPLGILAAAARQLAGLPVLFVGVRCPVEVIMERRNAAPEGYVAGPGVPEPVARWQQAVHQPGSYDLEVDSSVLSPEEAADAIAVALGQPPHPSAFAQLALK